jgi:hypothetical protein
MCRATIQVPCLHSIVGNGSCHEYTRKIRGSKIFAVRVSHISGQGVVTTFQSRSVAACRFRIQMLDGLAFLHSMCRATAVVFRPAMPEGLTLVG